MKIMGSLLRIVCIGVIIGHAHADIFQFGFAGTVPVVEDFDGDGLPDCALYHAAGGTWYIQQTSDGLRVTQWGFAGTLPVVADYDRDGKADIGVYNPADGMWYLDATRATRGNNTDRGSFSFIGSGYDNTASGDAAFVGNGQYNYAKGIACFIGCGVANNANGYGSSVVGGSANAATGNYAAIVGGTFNKAYGSCSFAGGKYAEAMHDGSFVWGDNNNFPVKTTAHNQFIVRARGGTKFVSATGAGGAATAGVNLAPGGNSWSALSDRNMKENFQPIDKRDLLERLSQIAVTTWNMKSQNPAIIHIGPMAQDFHAAFGVGEDEHYITTSDADGVALAAIQGLYDIMQEKDAEITALRIEKNNEINALQSRLAALEALVYDALCCSTSLADPDRTLSSPTPAAQPPARYTNK
ncbi:MAG: hypothetical protein EOM20_07310 [Spartobacteria bacterium]|nr:hypothetical protein [Spartobacteria bacterium]